MRLLLTILLLNLASIDADTGKTEPPTKPPSPTDAPTKPPSPTDAPTEESIDFGNLAPDDDFTDTDPPTRAPTEAPISFGNLAPDDDFTDDEAPTDAPVWPPTPPPIGNPPPTRAPIPSPTRPPTKLPTNEPTGTPTRPPTRKPTSEPTAAPTKRPTPPPTSRPTEAPISFGDLVPDTDAPTDAPVPAPTRPPIRPFTRPPTDPPTTSPTRRPTPARTPDPTPEPTPGPTPEPTPRPTSAPTEAPVTYGSIAPDPPTNVFDEANDSDCPVDTTMSLIGTTQGVLPTVVANFPVTVFAPVNNAFVSAFDVRAMDSTILLNHAVEGIITTQDIIDAGCMEMFSLSMMPLRIRYHKRQIWINDAVAACADVQGPGGNIIGIDSVIPSNSFRPCRNGYVEDAFENGLPDPQRVSEGSMYDAANEDGDYGILLAAITRSTGVMDAIAEHYPVTIFGPNNGAYSAMEDMLLETSIPDVGRLFSGHVVEGVYTLGEIVAAGCMELTTLAGTKIRVRENNRMITVNDSLLITPDMRGDDGIIQGIDKLIMPGSFEPCPGNSRAGTAEAIDEPIIPIVEDETEGTNKEEEEKGAKPKLNKQKKKEGERLLRLRGSDNTVM